MQIPGGLTFYQPETKFQTPKFASFDTIVRSVIAHRNGNPFLVKKNGWATDYESVASEVDAFNAAICQSHGWNQYIVEGGPAIASPKSLTPQPSLLQSSRRLAAGASVLVEWLNDGAEAVPADLANGRALTCVGCPQNEKGDWTSFFTKPVSNAILNQLNRRREMKLTTPSDDKLGVCNACSCPLPLKIHMPLDRILPKMTAESKAALDPRCWILRGDK